MEFLRAGNTALCCEQNLGSRGHLDTWCTCGQEHLPQSYDPGGGRGLGELPQYNFL